MIRPYPWWLYSKKLSSRIENPKYAGKLSPSVGMRRVIGREGNSLVLYWLVDESDGVIADASFEAVGPSALIGAADAASELLLRKNYDQAERITADLIDRQVRDQGGGEAFPKEAAPYLNQVIAAIESAASCCTDIPFAEAYAAPPMNLDLESGQEVAGWQELAKAAQIAIIEEVIGRDIRPYIELDAGGVQVVDLIEGRELVIAYQGACTTCLSSTGATLGAIQSILQAKVFKGIVVRPDFSALGASG